MLTLKDLEVNPSDAGQDASELMESFMEDKGVEDIFIILGQLDPMEKVNGENRWTPDQMVFIERANELLKQWENPEAQD